MEEIYKWHRFVEMHCSAFSQQLQKYSKDNV